MATLQPHIVRTIMLRKLRQPLPFPERGVAVQLIPHHCATCAQPEICVCAKRMEGKSVCYGGVCCGGGGEGGSFGEGGGLCVRVMCVYGCKCVGVWECGGVWVLGLVLLAGKIE